MTAIPDRLAAAVADRYAIERELGAGGMATVYLAHDVRHDRPVALKVLRPELSAILGGERFLAEIKTTANLQHPHILSLFDSGEADGLVFYVMPYVEGEVLRDRLTREKQLPVEEAVAIAREVADALSYAHAPRRGAPGHQAREHHAGGRPRAGGGLRDRACGEPQRRQHADDRDGHVASARRTTWRPSRRWASGRSRPRRTSTRWAA